MRLIITLVPGGVFMVMVVIVFLSLVEFTTNVFIMLCQCISETTIFAGDRFAWEFCIDLNVLD